MIKINILRAGFTCSFFIYVLLRLTKIRKKLTKRIY